MTTDDPDHNRGLYGKYRVQKLNGKPTGKVFVLAYDTDPHARVALAAYADSCAADYQQLATDLRAELAGTGGCPCACHHPHEGMQVTHLVACCRTAPEG